MGDMYVIGVDNGTPGYDYSARIVMRVNKDGTRTVISCKTFPATDRVLNHKQVENTTIIVSEDPNA